MHIPHSHALTCAEQQNGTHGAEKKRKTKHEEREIVNSTKAGN